MSTIATTIAGPKTYSAEELQALHLAMNAKAKRKKMLQKTALVTMYLIVCLFMLFPLLYTISVAFMPSGELAPPTCRRAPVPEYCRAAPEEEPAM